MALPNLYYSFLPGTRNVKFKDYRVLQRDLMKAIGTKTKQYYYRKRKGILNISLVEKEAIERVFHKYGITKESDIWEITPAPK